MEQFKLRCTFTGHDKDVRDISIGSKDRIYSGLRDGTVREWRRLAGWRTDEVEQVMVFNSPDNAFVNSVEYLGERGEPLVAAGGKDCIIYLVEANPATGVLSLPLESYVRFQLVGHQSNVCSLSHTGNYLISGSWDATSIVWDLNTMSAKYQLLGHESSVWDAKVIDPLNDIFLTCSADKSIRKWKGDKLLWKALGHTDVVRKLLLLPGNERFMSCSNDGTIRLWNLQDGSLLETYLSHEAFVYDLDILPNGDILSSGEDRTVRVWRDGSVTQVITFPCISVWCVSALPNGDFVAGGSDHLLRVFTRDESSMAPAEELQSFTEAVQNSTIAEQSLDNIKKTDLPGYEVLQKPGKNEGQTIMVKAPQGTIEAHQWSGGDWVKIGDVVGSASGSDGKKEFDGKYWDYLFDVDIEDGAPPLKLPYNANENPYVAAERFLSINELPSSYTEEVVQFIQKNTSGFTLDQGSRVNDPYSDAVNRTENKAKGSKLKLLPVKDYVHYNTFKVEQLAKGLQKFNSAESVENRFLDQEVTEVTALLTGLDSTQAVKLVTEYVPRILTTWKKESHLLGLDIERISITKITTADSLRSPQIAETIFKSIASCLDSVGEEDVPIFMMLLKVLANLIGNTLFIQIYLTTNSSGEVEFGNDFKSLLKTIEKKVTEMGSSTSARSNKHFATTMALLATFIFNLSVEYLKNTSLNSHTVNGRVIADIIDDVGEKIIEASPEAAYRICFAYGNFKYAYPDISEPSFYKTAISLYADTDQDRRFHDLSLDLKHL